MALKAEYKEFIRDGFPEAREAERRTLMQQMRNLQGQALFFASEAYLTFAAIDHVVNSIQAAGRKITREWLLGGEGPRLAVDITPAKARQSFLEQLGYIFEYLHKGGDAMSVAVKVGKYNIRVLDSFRIAGIDLKPYEGVVDVTVIVDSYRTSDGMLSNRFAVREMLRALSEKATTTSDAAERAKLESTIKSAQDKLAIIDRDMRMNAGKGIEAHEKSLSDLTTELSKAGGGDIKAAAVKTASTFVDAAKDALRKLSGEAAAMDIETRSSGRDKTIRITDLTKPADSLDQLLNRFSGQWDDIRAAYQRGEVSEAVMKDLVSKRRKIIDALADSVTADLYGEDTVAKEKMWMAVGSEKLTSDYDISFLGPKAELAVVLFNARFAAGWGTVGRVGGSESANRFDTNVYTDPAFRQFVGRGNRDVAMQETAAYAAARKYMTDAQWANLRATVEAAAPEGRKAGLASILDRIEIGYRNANVTIVDKAVEIAQQHGRTRPVPQDFTEAQNRIYEDNLRRIIQIREQFENAVNQGNTQLAQQLAQEIRDTQSRSLYFAQEAYLTEHAITHVVFNTQAVERAITVESLMAKGPPQLAQPIDTNGARQSFIEQMANIYKEINHHGEPDKTAGKIAKYFVRALDAAKIAGVEFPPSLRPLIEKTVELGKVKDKPEQLKDAVSKVSPDGSVERGAEIYENAVAAVLSRLARGLVGDMDYGLTLPAVEAVNAPTATRLAPGRSGGPGSLSPKLWDQVAKRKATIELADTPSAEQAKADWWRVREPTPPNGHEHPQRLIKFTRSDNGETLKVEMTVIGGDVNSPDRGETMTFEIPYARAPIDLKLQPGQFWGHSDWYTEPAPMRTGSSKQSAVR